MAALTPEQIAAYNRAKALFLVQLARKGTGLVGAALGKLGQQKVGIGCTPCQENALRSLGGQATTGGAP